MYVMFSLFTLLLTFYCFNDSWHFFLFLFFVFSFLFSAVFSQLLLNRSMHIACSYFLYIFSKPTNLFFSKVENTRTVLFSFSLLHNWPWKLGSLESRPEKAWGLLCATPDRVPRGLLVKEYSAGSNSPKVIEFKVECWKHKYIFLLLL